MWLLQFTVNDLDLLFKVSQIIFQALHTALHLAEHRSGVFRLGCEEAHIVLIRLQLALALLISPHQTLTLAVKTVFVIADLLDRILERSHARSALRKVELLIKLIYHRTVSLIDSVFLAERHMTHALPFGLKVFDSLDSRLAAELVGIDSFELLDDLVLLFEVRALGAACA